MCNHFDYSTSSIRVLKFGKQSMSVLFSFQNFICVLKITQSDVIVVGSRTYIEHWTAKQLLQSFNTTYELIYLANRI